MSGPMHRLRILTAQACGSDDAALPPTVNATPEFQANPIQFLTAQRRVHPEAFTLRRSEREQYVVLADAKMIESALDDESIFGEPMTPNMSVNKNVFGVPLDTLEKHETRVVKSLRGFLIRNKDALANRIAEQLKEYLGRKIGDENVMDLRDLGEAIFWPMTQALFGDHSVESVEPRLYSAWEKIDGLFGKALRGHVLPEVTSSVDIASKNFKDAITGASGCPMGPALKFYNDEVGRSNGGDDDAAARLATAAWWGGLGNTWPSVVWTFGMILADPDCRRKAYEEVDREFCNLPDADGHYDVDCLEFLTSALNEVMRLKTYSIAWRLTKADVTLEAESGHRYRLPKRTLVAVPWCVHHYNEEIWAQPSEFRPDRHMGGSELASRKLSPVRARFALSPFSWGPHKCSGYPLAMVEIPIALAVTFQLYDMELLDPLPGDDWKSAFGVVGPDSKPARIKFRRRKNVA